MVGWLVERTMSCHGLLLLFCCCCFAVLLFCCVQPLTSTDLLLSGATGWAVDFVHRLIPDAAGKTEEDLKMIVETALDFAEACQVYRMQMYVIMQR